MRRIIGIVFLAGLLSSCGDTSYRADVTAHPSGAEVTIIINDGEGGTCFGDTSFTCPDSGCLAVSASRAGEGVYLQVWKVRDGGLNGLFFGDEEFVGHDSALGSGATAEVCW